MLGMVEMYSNWTSHSLNDELAVLAITFSQTFPCLFRLGKVASTHHDHCSKEQIKLIGSLIYKRLCCSSTTHQFSLSFGTFQQISISER